LGIKGIIKQLKPFQMKKVFAIFVIAALTACGGASTETATGTASPEASTSTTTTDAGSATGTATGTVSSTN
jgi:hypothetical protein